MKTPFKAVICCCAMFSGASIAGGMHEPLIGMMKLDQLERQHSDEGDATAWNGYAWLGYDLDKVWIKSKGARAEGATQDSEFQLLYSRAISAFWDVQFGWRHDALPRPNRDWVALTLHGLSPYFIETELEFFANESGDVQARFNAEYEYLFTQRLILSPELEVTLNGYNDLERGEGSGLADVEAGLRLRYEIRREFAPYLGVSWEKAFGHTADMHDEEASETQWVAGLRIWY